MSSTDHVPEAHVPGTQSPTPAGSPDGTAVKPVLTPAAAKRANASVIGMIMALLVSVLAIVPVVLLNASQKADTFRPEVDVAAISANAKPVAGFTPVVPKLPSGYSPNYARWVSGTSDGVSHWDIGYLTPSQQFVSIVQTASANPTWITTQVKKAPKTGTRTEAGVEWTLYDKPGVEKSLVASVGTTTVVVSGSGGFDEFDAVAGAVVNASR
ncbi:hypothetical protein GCM10027449_11670 [Sinomonas notoginsengisoli]|uniref:DUF4245 domain-containing protein n=1 Tax=Sinomonas notoginsengisoli TaxID=1457311 RepID=UPI001F410E0E|nr:DUF4245 domain-containing protein [Sinomonas notoginsengisoli]